MGRAVISRYMMTEQQKLMIFKTYGDMKIIMCGDLGYQLPAIDGEEMNTKLFENVQKHLNDYRCQDPQLREIKNHLRNMISSNKSICEINQWVIRRFKELKRNISVEQLQQMYKIKNTILTGTNETKNVYTEMFKHIEKYYCKENNRVYCNGDIIIGEKPDCKSELRHAYTTHSIQGETAYNNLFIDDPNC